MLIFFAIYVLSTAKLQISPHYGVRGKGALVGGYVCLGIGLLMQALLLVSGVSFSVNAICSTAVIFVVVPLTLVVVVHFYGNDSLSPTDSRAVPARSAITSPD